MPDLGGFTQCRLISSHGEMFKLQIAVLCEVLVIADGWHFFLEQIKERSYNLLCWQIPYVSSCMLQQQFHVTG